MIQFKKQKRTIRLKLPPLAQQVRDIAVEVMESPEMYDLLPGNGEDDYIIGQFTKMLDERLKALRIASATPLHGESDISGDRAAVAQEKENK